jgi:hypothetical protein
LEVTLRQGQVKIEAHGFEGETCLQATEAVEHALGQVVKRTRKDAGVSVGLRVQA